MRHSLQGDKAFRVRIGTRKSRLALAQSEYVAGLLRSLNPGIVTSLVKITTSGDKILDVPLAKVGGKGLFVKEIEEALLRKEIDIAVHSMKDLPSELPKGLVIAACPVREDPRDAIVSNGASDILRLPKGSRIGTSSLRRRGQLLALRPDLRIVPIRGNVDTRLKKLESEGLDGVMLAVAGIKRLGLRPANLSPIPPDVILPAIGQGCLAIEAREEDRDVMEILLPLNHKETVTAMVAERSFLRTMGGGCQVPMGGLAEVADGLVRLRAVLADEEEGRLLKVETEGSVEDAEMVGKNAALEILGRGGSEILKRLMSVSVDGG